MVVETDLPDVKSFRLVQLSNFFFLQASFCYFVSAWKDNSNGGTNSDDETQQNITWILFGAIGWVIVGLVDWFNKKHWFHIFLVLAGIFGLGSACLKLITEPGSEMLNFLSVHCFLLEAISLLRQDMKLNNSMIILLLRIADTCFFLGAMTDIVLSYIYLGQQEDLSSRERLVGLQKGELASSTFWMLAAIGNIIVTATAGKGGMKTSQEYIGGGGGTEQEATNLSEMA